MNTNFKSKAMKAHETQYLLSKISTTKVPTSSLSSSQSVGLLSTLEPLQVTTEVDLGPSLKVLSRGGQYKLPGTKPQPWEFPGDA
jgi:hypothetical protein